MTRLFCMEGNRSMSMLLTLLQRAGLPRVREKPGPDGPSRGPKLAREAMMKTILTTAYATKSVVGVGVAQGG